LFYAIAASMFVLQVGGIITVPDLPLLFFTALFFLEYKKFIVASPYYRIVTLGIIMALMLYSKYHGILIIFFTLLSNLRLLTRWQTWLAAAICAILFLPHLLWQYSHGLPSVYYHLFERNASQYKFSFTSEYLLGQIALAGPLIGWLLLYAFFRKRPKNQMEKPCGGPLSACTAFFCWPVSREGWKPTGRCLHLSGSSYWRISISLMPLACKNGYIACSGPQWH
jgi:hypothetical protein